MKTSLTSHTNPSPLKLVAQSSNSNDFSLQPTPPKELEKVEKAYQKLLARKDLGFLHLPQHLNSESTKNNFNNNFNNNINNNIDSWDFIQNLAKKYSHFKTLAIVGIGGSAVGTEAVLRALRPDLSSLVIFDTPYEFDVLRKLNGLNLESTLFFIVSKSGNTLETLFCTDLIYNAYQEKGLNFYKNALVATEEKQSPLYNWAMQHSILNLEVPRDVGGRFSVLSCVGLFPFAFFGVDLPKLRLGALQAHEDKKLLLQVAAQLMKGFQEQEALTYFWFYFSELQLFKTWVHQLWAESLGKKTNKSGQVNYASVPFVALGPQDQHSIQQQVLDGSFKKSCLFFRETPRAGLLQIKHSQFENSFWQNKSGYEIVHCQSEATFRACANNNIPSLLFEIGGINEQSLGNLIHFFQLLVGVLGEALEINAFDQPAVETGKILTKELLSKSSRPTTKL